MNIKKIDKKLIDEKILLLEKHLERLMGLKILSPKELQKSDHFDVAAWNLRSALEATFDICAHILSRMPGVKIEEYKQMATEMGKQKIVPKNFSQNSLYKMAGYRNRLTHFYFEVTPKEMHDILQNHLQDFDIFLKYIKKIF